MTNTHEPFYSRQGTVQPLYMDNLIWVPQNSMKQVQHLPCFEFFHESTWNYYYFNLFIVCLKILPTSHACFLGRGAHCLINGSFFPQHLGECWNMVGIQQCMLSDTQLTCKFCEPKCCVSLGVMVFSETSTMWMFEYVDWKAGEVTSVKIDNSCKKMCKIILKTRICCVQL